MKETCRMSDLMQINKNEEGIGLTFGVRKCSCGRAVRDSIRRRKAMAKSKETLTSVITLAAAFPEITKFEFPTKINKNINR